MHVHHHAVGVGPALLVTHGFCATSHMFAGVADALAPSHRVITWDIRGHGKTDSPADPAEYSVAHSMDDMLAILDAGGVDRAVLMGHSLGGYLSLELQRRHPERVAALVLVGTGPGYRKDEPREGWNAMCETFAVDLETKGLDGLPASEEVRPDVHRGAQGLAHAARGILRQHDSAVLDHLPAIDVPVLVIVGDRDRPFVNSSTYMADKIPGATLAVLEGAGHAPMLSHPDAFLAVVTAFLDR
jgi:pimeloyl-ACP methyl ester carboxylesterase